MNHPLLTLVCVAIGILIVVVVLALEWPSSEKDRIEMEVRETERRIRELHRKAREEMLRWMRGGEAP